MLSFEKNCKIILFRSLTMISENTPKIMLIGPPVMQKQPFKKLKILLFLPPFISKAKMVDIFNFPSLKCFGYCLSFWIFDIYGSTIVEITDRRTSYFGSLDTADNNLITDEGLANLLTAVNLQIHLFERYYQ